MDKLQFEDSARLVPRVTHHFLAMCSRLRAIFLALLGIIMLGAGAIAVYENMPLGEAMYFSFITGLTIGYGDIVAHTTDGRIICVALGFAGILFSGLVVAITVRAVENALAELKESD